MGEGDSEQNEQPSLSGKPRTLTPAIVCTESHYSCLTLPFSSPAEHLLCQN